MAAGGGSELKLGRPSGRLAGGWLERLVLARAWWEADRWVCQGLQEVVSRPEWFAAGRLLGELLLELLLHIVHCSGPKDCQQTLYISGAPGLVRRLTLLHCFG